MKFHVMNGNARGVCIRVDDGENSLHFWADGGLDKFTANAVREHIDRAMRSHVKAIKREAYLAGWKDAKGKKPKKTHFYGCLNADPQAVGY